MHPTEGDLRAYHDGELSDGERRWVTSHLADCAACQEQVERLGQRARWTERRLALLAPDMPALPARAARARLDSHPTHEKGRRLMKTATLARQYRPVWTGLAVAAVLVMALLLPPVRALATDFLGLFRVQNIEVVGVNPGEEFEYMGPLALFERMFADNVQVESRGETTDADSAASAASLAGFPVRLPTLASGERRIRVQQGAQVTLTIDLQQVDGVLRELERTGVSLPESLEGERVTIEIPRAVTAAYGVCDGESAAPCVRLVQLPSPTVSAPPELDVKQLGAAFLQIMGMSQEEATRFSQEVDWATTLVIPVPGEYTYYRAVQVDGVSGTLIEMEGDNGATRTMLLWVREGIVYALRGATSADEALAIANSLE